MGCRLINFTLNQKEVIMACGSKKSGGKKPPKK